MNNFRRNLLMKALQALDTAETYAQRALEEEQGCFDNIPESFDGTERYDKMENAIDNLECALDSISDAKTQIEDASV